MQCLSVKHMDIINFCLWLFYLLKYSKYDSQQKVFTWSYSLKFKIKSVSLFSVWCMRSLGSKDTEKSPFTELRWAIKGWMAT